MVVVSRFGETFARMFFMKAELVCNFLAQWLLLFNAALLCFESAKENPEALTPSLFPFPLYVYCNVSND